MFALHDRSLMNCYHNVTKCPECKGELGEPTLVAGKRTLCSPAAVVPKEEFYIALQGPVKNTVSCERCDAKFNSYRALVLHYLDGCMAITSPCDLCDKDVCRDVGDHVEVCTGLWCRHHNHCLFRGTKTQIQHHIKVYNITAVADRFLQQAAPAQIVDVMRRVDDIVQLMAVNNDNDSDDNVHVMSDNTDDETEEVDLLSSPGPRRSPSPAF